MVYIYIIRKKKHRLWSHYPNLYNEEKIQNDYLKYVYISEKKSVQIMSFFKNTYLLGRDRLWSFSNNYFPKLLLSFIAIIISYIPVYWLRFKSTFSWCTYVLWGRPMFVFYAWVSTIILYLLSPPRLCTNDRLIVHTFPELNY